MARAGVGSEPGQSKTRALPARDRRGRPVGFRSLFVVCATPASLLPTLRVSLRCLGVLWVQRPQPLGRGLADAALGDQPGDESRRRDVEGVVAGGTAGGGDVDAHDLAVLGAAA